MPKPLIITLKEGVDPIYGFQKAPAPQGMSHQGQYVLMDKTNTYALGVQALLEACGKELHSPHPIFTKDNGSTIYRPLTFKETIEARVHDYESNKDTEERKRLFQRWNDSCTAVAYKKGTTTFKLVHQSKDLITIPEDFNAAFLPTTYDDIDGIELRSDCGKYNQHLTKDEVVHHPAWLTAVENDAALLRIYSDIVFTELKKNEAMAFCVRQNTAGDELLALLVHDLNYNSNANGDDSLGISGSFLLVAPSGAAGATRAKMIRFPKC